MTMNLKDKVLLVIGVAIVIWYPYSGSADAKPSANAVSFPDPPHGMPEPRSGYPHLGN